MREVRDRLEASPGAQLVRSSAPEAQTLASQRTQQKREARLELYQQMTELIARGKSQAEAATSVGISLQTVQRWITTGVFPERKHRVFPSHVDAFGPYLESVLRKAAPTRHNSGARSGSRASEEIYPAYGAGYSVASYPCGHPN